VKHLVDWWAADVAVEPGAATFAESNGAGKTNLAEAAGWPPSAGTGCPLMRRWSGGGGDRAILRAAISAAARDGVPEIEPSGRPPYA